MWFWIKSQSLAKHRRLGEAGTLKWESAQLYYRLLFLFLRENASDWLDLARGGRTVCLWVFLLSLREWDLMTEFCHYFNPV